MRTDLCDGMSDVRIQRACIEHVRTPWCVRRTGASEDQRASSVDNSAGFAWFILAMAEERNTNRSLYYIITSLGINAIFTFVCPGARGLGERAANCQPPFVRARGAGRSERYRGRNTHTSRPGEGVGKPVTIHELSRWSDSAGR